MDLVIEVNQMPIKGETINGKNFFTNPGGKGANQAVAISKSGHHVKFVGSVGETFGDSLVESLKSYEVDVTYVEKCNSVSSGVAMIIIDNQDNRIIIDHGANYSLTKNQIDKSLSEAKKGDFIVLQYEIPKEIIEYTLVIAKQKGLITFFNPAPSNQFEKDYFRYVDYLILNQSESQYFTNIYPTDKETSIEVSNIFKSMYVKNILITLGSKGSVFIGENIYVQKAYKTKVVDTTAAGDTFIGALVSQLALNKDIKEAMDFASKAASICVGRKGAQISIPYKFEIDNI